MIDLGDEVWIPKGILCKWGDKIKGESSKGSNESNKSLSTNGGSQQYHPILFQIRMKYTKNSNALATGWVQNLNISKIVM